MSVSVSPDHSSAEGIGFRDGGTGVVQFFIGRTVELTVVTADGARLVIGHSADGAVLTGVVEAHHGITAALAPPARALESKEDWAVEPANAVQSEVSPAPVAVSVSVPALDPDETILTPRAPEPPTHEPATPEPPTPEPPRTDVDMDVDETIIGGVAAAPATNGAAATAGRPLRILRVEVTDANGARAFELDGALYVGRAPRVPAERASVHTALAVVASTTDHVSATHLQLIDDDGQLLARDLWSTNGTVLTPAVGAPYRLEPGEILPLAEGSRLTLADDVFIEVARAQ